VDLDLICFVRKAGILDDADLDPAIQNRRSRSEVLELPRSEAKQEPIVKRDRWFRETFELALEFAGARDGLDVGPGEDRFEPAQAAFGYLRSLDPEDGSLAGKVIAFTVQSDLDQDLTAIVGKLDSGNVANLDSTILKRGIGRPDSFCVAEPEGDLWPTMGQVVFEIESAGKKGR
jgi:hypothetical protein